MKYLSQFTPAENLILLEGSRFSFRDQLKYTLMDLFFKKVLQTKEISRQVSKRDPEVSYNYVVAGQNFSAYRPQAHEMVFLLPYYKNRGIKILFRHLVKMGFENAESKAKMFTFISKGKAGNFFRKNVFQQVFGGFSYTREGAKAKEELKQEVAVLETDISGINYNPQNIHRLIGIVFGNICLTSVDMEMIGTIDRELNKEMQGTTADAYSGWSSCGSWSSFDYGSSGCSSGGCSGSGDSWFGDVGGGDSGCGSGCSGCSGSGCSGCGSD